MRYPTISRENARHRGPVESHKFSQIADAVEHDFKYLFERIGLITEDTKKTFSDMYGEGQKRTEQLSYITSDNSYLKGGESRV